MVLIASETSIPNAIELPLYYGLGTLSKNELIGPHFFENQNVKGERIIKIWIATMHFQDFENVQEAWFSNRVVLLSILLLLCFNIQTRSLQKVGCEEQVRFFGILFHEI